MLHAGVTSNAGFQHFISFGALDVAINSSPGRSSMGIDFPVGSVVSQLVNGAATKNGTLWYFAIILRLYVPILLAVSPLAHTRSAPTTTASIGWVLNQ